MSSLKYIPLLCVMLPSIAMAQTSGALLIGQGAGQSPKYTLLSQDCTSTNTGAITCAFAGAGGGNFDAGSLGVGATPDGTFGDILNSGGIGVGVTSSTVTAGAGNVVIDNAFTCNNAAVATGVNCINANNGLAMFSLISITAAGAFQFGASVNGPAINFVTSNINSMTFAAGGPTLMAIATGTVRIPNNAGTALELTNGAVLSMTGGTIPTLSAGCNGAGSSVATGSTDNRGKFTTQTAAATTCTLHFNHTYPQAPFCVFTDCNASITPVAFSTGLINTTTAVVDFASATNTVICYHCE